MENYELYTSYSGAVGKCGVGSPEANRIRHENQHDSTFLEYADAVDRLKERLSTAQPVAAEAEQAAPTHCKEAVVGI